MSEADIVNRTPHPITQAQLVTDLRHLGVQPEMTLLVHSSLSALGWVIGGPIAVIQALMDVLTPQGTLIMPTHTGDGSEPSLWQNPPVPKNWWPVIREHWPAYSPAITPTRGMGRIVEIFRTWPGVIRSQHPQMSFAAWGRQAAWITDDHSLDYGLGEGSPLARIYDLGGWVLLLGVGYDSNTSFHLAEYRIPSRRQENNGSAIMVKGRREWRILEDIALNTDVFPQIGADYERTTTVTVANVGLAQSRLFHQPPAVDFAQRWLQERQPEL